MPVLVKNEFGNSERFSCRDRNQPVFVESSCITTTERNGDRELDQKRLLVLGDVHGRLELMNSVLKKANYDPTNDRLILLGDYVDRGPESQGVVARVRELSGQGAIALKGNHEAMMVEALRTKDFQHWFMNGGEATLKSYRDCKETLLADVDFLDGLPLTHEDGEFFFAHAGVNPEKPLNGQTPYDLLWIRDEFILGYKGEKRIVAGHTPISFVAALTGKTEIETDKPLLTKHVILMDTGAGHRGKLSLLDLTTEKLWQAK